MDGHRGTRRMPKVELRHLTDDYCEFVLRDTDQSMSNALRRIILAEVRTGGGRRRRAGHACVQLGGGAVQARGRY